jgi:hypothetical protein
MMHYSFDDPMDISELLRSIAADVEEAPQPFPHSPHDPIISEYQIAIGALREAADKIEKAVYSASGQSAESGR